MEVWRAAPPRPPTALIDKLRADKDVTSKLDEKQLSACFDDAHHFRHVDTIFSRVFG
jgi:adenylosuccinate lyase